MSYVAFKSRFTGNFYVVSLCKIRRLLFTSETIASLSDSYVVFGVDSTEDHVPGDSHLIRMIDKFPSLPWPLDNGIDESMVEGFTNEEIIDVLLMENM